MANMKNDIENPVKTTVKAVDGMGGWGLIDMRPSSMDYSNLRTGFFPFLAVQAVTVTFLKQKLYKTLLNRVFEGDFNYIKHSQQKF